MEMLRGVGGGGGEPSKWGSNVLTRVSISVQIYTVNYFTEFSSLEKC